MRKVFDPVFCNHRDPSSHERLIHDMPALFCYPTRVGVSTKAANETWTLNEVGVIGLKNGV